MFNLFCTTTTTTTTTTTRVTIECPCTITKVLIIVTLNTKLQGQFTYSSRSQLRYVQQRSVTGETDGPLSAAEKTTVMRRP